MSSPAAKSIYLWAGLAFLLVGAPGLALLHVEQARTRHERDEAAYGRDRSRSRIAAGPCVGVLKGIEKTSRIPEIGHAFNLAIQLSNTNTTTCSAQILVSASSFEVQPDKPVGVELAHEERRLLWNLTPKIPGEQVILVSANTEQQEFGFYVEDSKLLPDWAPIVGSIASAIFGPMITIPWWMERREKRREEREKARLAEKRKPIGFK